jgi:hypothetical protein
MSEEGRWRRETAVLNDSERQNQLTDLRRTVEEQQRRIWELGEIVSIWREQTNTGHVVEGAVGRLDSEIEPSRRLDEGEINPWWPVPAFPELSIVPAPGFACATLAGKNVRSIAISVLGREGADLEEIVSLIASRQAEGRDFLPVFLANASDLGAIQRQGFAFEYFARRLYPHPDDALVSSRYDFVSRKWGIESFLDFGKAWSMQSASEELLRTIPVTNETALIVVSSKTPALDKTSIGEERRQILLRGQDQSAGADTKRNDEMIIRESGIFDEDWYRAQNPDVARRGLDPVRHYLDEGALRGRDPSPLFHTFFYARQMAAYRQRGGE